MGMQDMERSMGRGSMVAAAAAQLTRRCIQRPLSSCCSWAMGRLPPPAWRDAVQRVLLLPAWCDAAQQVLLPPLPGGGAAAGRQLQWNGGNTSGRL